MEYYRGGRRGLRSVEVDEVKREREKVAGEVEADQSMPSIRPLPSLIP